MLYYTICGRRPRRPSASARPRSRSAPGKSGSVNTVAVASNTAMLAESSECMVLYLFVHDYQCSRIEMIRDNASLCAAEVHAQTCTLCLRSLTDCSMRCRSAVAVLARVHLCGSPRVQRLFPSLSP